VEREGVKDIANCKSQIANCKLSRPDAQDGVGSPASAHPDTFRTATSQFAICNLQFAICSAFHLLALELRAGGLGARGVLQLSIFGETDRGPALRAAVARIQDRFGERAVRHAVQLLAELQFQS
jgi:hypothetical protein